MKIITTSILTILITLANAQTVDENTEFVKPVKLPAHINSSEEEIYPITFDKQLYYVKAFSKKNKGGEQSGHDIWESDKSATGDWGVPKNFFGSLNSQGSNAVVGFSKDKSRIYLMNSYNGELESKPGLAVSKKSGNGWTKPVNIEVPGLEPTTRVYGLFIDPLEEVIFISMEKEETLGKEDLYVCSFSDGKVSTPIHLKEISSKGYDMSPFLGPDRKTLYFSSDREGGLGSADIYKVTKTGDSWTNWSNPENLGPVINSNKFDAYFSMFKDSTAYFSSNRGGGKSNIYETELVGKKDTLKSPNEEGDIEYHFNQENFVYFDFDKYQLKPAMRNFLDNVIENLQSREDLKRITLEGYTDYIGTEEYNKKLGKKRALTVKKYLLSKGVSAENVELISYGETRPHLPGKVNGEDMPTFRARNRRVRIEIVK